MKWPRYPDGSWSGARKGRRFSTGWQVNLWPVSRPRLWASWPDDDVVMFCVDWGNGNSDPVWDVWVEVRRAPRWLLWLAAKVER